MKLKQFLAAECSECKRSIRYCAEDLSRREYGICPECGAKIRLSHAA